MVTVILRQTDMQVIKLSRGQTCKVDKELLQELNKNSWYMATNGYARRGTKKNGKTTIHYMYRQIMGYPKGVVDHINGDKLDNRKSNLRVVNQSVNGHNRHGLNRNNKSGINGVYYDKARNKYVAEIWKNYKKISKRFDSKKQAIKQRKDWEQLC